MEYEIKPKEKFSLGLRELWQYKELFYFFTWRDVKVKYKQTALGFAWVILQPFFMMVIFSLFFGKALNIPSENIPYPLFVFSGLILWNVFSVGVTVAGNGMISNANIIKKIYFPRLIIPISSVLVSLFDFLIAFMIFIGMLIYYQVSFSILKFLVYVPLGLIITSISTFGMGTLLAALNIKYRDFRYVIPFLIQALLFVTPVIYPVSILTNQWIRYIVALNPMYSAITLFRLGIVDSPVQLNLVLISLLSSVLCFIIGLYYFRKTENYFADLA
ncbi:MAG: transporter permease [Bacteroidetes bacterium]|jgi:lipopolysaccharide transport system permease protein|nr:transporter permease [Bacteroidota bacterium]MDF2452254.1 transporter permease [Bacteroidota bacterium]